MPRWLRALRYAGALGLAVWWGRVVAHSKVPPPEGTWREVDVEELPL